MDDLPVNAITVFSPREHDLLPILENHARLEGIGRRYWLANGVGDATHGMLLASAAAMRTPVTILRCGVILPIARAYNQLLATADAECPDSDILMIQDDIEAPPNLAAALRSSDYDMPGAWHDDRPPKLYTVDDLDYCVWMACLLRRRVFQRCGYCNELFLRGVDAEYGCRAAAMGFSVGHIEFPRVHHHGRRTTGGDNEGVRMIHQQAMYLIKFLRDRGHLAEWQGCRLNARYGILFFRSDINQS